MRKHRDLKVKIVNAGQVENLADRVAALMLRAEQRRAGKQNEKVS